ncbi:hypothetical protein F25303_7778 [Fusarium sp. NRRL 25303]|nr:hypothetical protein F25303_7778 [Fusarium sp. NRRL 25303]
MAEAFGIAGSAFGTVSLGLQLFKEISQYLDDIHGRQEDLKQARTYANNLQLTITALHVAISNAPPSDPDTKSAMDSCEASCVTTVNELLAVVKKLRGPTPVPNSRRAKAKDLRAKLKYPFKKENMEKLEKHLFRTNISLQSTLQVLLLYAILTHRILKTYANLYSQISNTGKATNQAILSMQQTMTNANVMSGTSREALDKMEETSRLHGDRLSSVQQDVREILILTRKSSEWKRSTGSIALLGLNIPPDPNYSTNLQQHQASGASAPSVRTKSFQGGGSITFDGLCSCKTHRTRYSRSILGPFVVEAEIRSRDHHAPECPMSKLPAAKRQTKRIWKFSIPTLQSYWRSASKMTLSYTTGAGRLGIGQAVAWIATVDMQRKDMHTLLTSYFRRLVWCYASNHASPTDVNEHDDTLLEWALENYKPVTHSRNIRAVILLYADAKALRITDNGGYYPIDYVTTRTQPCHNLEAQEGCGARKLLEVLLKLDIALLPSSLHLGLRPSWYHIVQCMQGVEVLIKGLAERREKLKELANKTLSWTERQHLKIHPARILDRNAAQVQYQLESQGCTLPMYLKVYEGKGVPPSARKSIYSHIFSGVVAEYAHQLGFYFSSDELHDFISSLATLICAFPGGRRIVSNPFSASYFCWMVDCGVDVSSRLPTGQLPSLEIDMTTAHYFMVSLGTWAHYGRQSAQDCPLSQEAFETVLSRTTVDSCRCWCSPMGCTPLIKLLEGIHSTVKPHRFFEFMINRLTNVAVDSITNLFFMQIDHIGKYKWIYAAIVRYYTFVMLDLRHVCCSITHPPSGPLPEEEYWEIQEEDSFRLKIFNSLLTEFEEGCRHDMRLEDFFEWLRTVWVPRMREVKQELASEKLTGQQLHDAEMIGVVWESFGPQPVDTTFQTKKTGKVDLWDAMDELDEIATDPERPMRDS